MAPITMMTTPARTNLWTVFDDGVTVVIAFSLMKVHLQKCRVCEAGVPACRWHDLPLTEL